METVESARHAVHEFTVGGVGARELAERYGTPLYAYDAAVIRQRFRSFAESVAHRPLAVYYSVKAHANVALLALIRELGGGADTCSPGDLAFAQAAGFRGERISYTGHGMSDEELGGLLDSGAFPVLDSLSQLERTGRMVRAGRAGSPVREVGLRVHSGVAAGFHPHARDGVDESKFGVRPEQLGQALEIAARHGLRIAGLHSHLGSDLLDCAAHVELLRRLLCWSRTLPDARFVDIGGGWGTPFRDQRGRFTEAPYDLAAFGQEATALLSHFQRDNGRVLELRLEPGAYLVLDAGVLITRVTEEKPAVRGAGGHSPHFVCTDTSYNHLASAVVYGTYHEVWVADRPAAPRTRTYHVVGNLMQAGDVLARARALPPVAPGDVLVFEKCGAYKACRGSQFNERPRPAEVLVDGGQPRLIRHHETVEDLLATQVY